MPIVIKLSSFDKFLFFILLLTFCHVLLSINFRNDTLTFSELLIDPINRIITLTPYEIDEGSIFGRTNATIYGLINYFNSNMLGIGIGNSYTMLTMYEYTVASAQSMHNLPLQLLVENGIIVLFLYLFIIYYFFKILFQQKINDYKFIQLIAIPSFLIGSLSSSGGVFSNYYFITCLFIVILLNKNTLSNQTKLKEL
ncbi:O-antigen ligase family protein [Aliarcobacter butzleri]|uniref:O-antigen ligase family protein n=1 Tax=Aliarcobacter butzleri TaxID=28197 RepID=UPI003AF6E594